MSSGNLLCASCEPLPLCFGTCPLSRCCLLKFFTASLYPPRSAFVIALCLRKSFPRFVCCLQLLFCIFFVTWGELCLTIQSSYLPSPTMSQSAHFVFFFWRTVQLTHSSCPLSWMMLQPILAVFSTYSRALLTVWFTRSTRHRRRCYNCSLLFFLSSS